MTARRLSPEELEEIRGHCDNLAAASEHALFAHIEALEAEESKACGEWREIVAERDRLRAEVERLRGALETYASPGWHSPELARAALGERSSASPNREG